MYTKLLSFTLITLLIGVGAVFFDAGVSNIGAWVVVVLLYFLLGWVGLAVYGLFGSDGHYAGIRRAYARRSAVCVTMVLAGYTGSVAWEYTAPALALASAFAALAGVAISVLFGADGLAKCLWTRGQEPIYAEKLDRWNNRGVARTGIVTHWGEGGHHYKRTEDGTLVEVLYNDNDEPVYRVVGTDEILTEVTVVQ